MLVYKPELDSLYDNVLLFGNKRIVSMDVEEYLNGIYSLVKNTHKPFNKNERMHFGYSEFFVIFK